MRRISIVNQKGGVGKTTTAINLSAALAVAEKHVLLVDTDAQTNATSGLGIDSRELELSTYEVLNEPGRVREAIRPTAVRFLDIIPASIDLAGLEIELVDTELRASRLREAVAPLDSQYDYIIMDAPPSLGLLTVNALVAAEGVLIPVQCEYYSLEGIGKLLDTLNRVRFSLNPGLEIFGVLLTMYDVRTNLSEQVAEEVRKYFQDKVFDTVIPRNVLRIPIKLIATNPYQPRKISGQEISELAASIKEHGMLQPILVRRKGTSYQLLVGSRRLKAAELAGLAEIPAIIRKAADRQMLALALVENLQREDLNPIEAALAYRKLVDEFGMSQEDVAKVVGKDRSTVANTLRLLGLPRKARKLLEEDRITEGHARALLQISSVSLVDKLCDRIVADGLTVRAVEQIARSAAKVKMPQRRKRKDAIAEAAEELISEKLGIKVRVVRSRKGGKIELRYANEDELNRLLEWFRSR